MIGGEDEKLKMFSVVAVIFLLTIPMVSYAETGQKCALDCVNKCSPLGSGKEYATCLENCLKGCYDKPTGIPEVPPPTPANPSSSKSGNNADIIIAADDAKMVCAHAEKSSGDSCCQNTRGETKGYCPEGYPVFKDVSDDTCPNGKCFKYGYDCMKAGWGFCYTCSRCEDSSSGRRRQ
jgi:hypothetical protein